MTGNNKNEIILSPDWAFKNGCLPLIAFMGVTTYSGFRIFSEIINNKTIDLYSVVGLTTGITGLTISVKNLFSYIKS